MRTVVTDGEGAYRVVDLRPGLYAVTFSLPGFTSVKRDGIALPAAFTATVNAELSVGALEETVRCLGGCTARRRSKRVVRAAAFRRTARKLFQPPDPRRASRRSRQGLSAQVSILSEAVEKK